MIESDGAHHADIGVDDVRGVEATAQPDFENGDFDGTPGEDVEGRQRVVFEERERGRPTSGVDALESGDQLFVARLDTVDADAFVVAYEVR